MKPTFNTDVAEVYVIMFGFQFTIPKFAIPTMKSLSNPNPNSNQSLSLYELLFFGIGNFYLMFVHLMVVVRKRGSLH